MKNLVFALSLLLTLPALARDYFKVDFNDAKPEEKPAVQPYNRNIGSTAPTKLSELEPGLVKVIEKTATLTERPLLFNLGLSSSPATELVFDGGNNLVTSGTVLIDFDVEPVSYKPTSDGRIETAFSIRVTGNSGIDIASIVFAATKPDSGAMALFPIGGPKVDLGSYELGKLYKFALALDLTAGELTVGINGEIRADKVKINAANAYRLIRFRSGQALGGRDGALTVALDNIHIYDQQ